MNKRLYNFLANYQWYFVGVFVYLFVRGYDLIKDIAVGITLVKIWFIASGLVTLFTQFYFHKHKTYQPEYQRSYIALAILVTVLIIELITNL